ncbi:MAG: WYL domain-containing protein [Deltaproteobacteria bacterium]|nr:WYL domain-containing protein [Deltaproteobacteria bacterium]MBW2724290.1 WYL domain-containing protein [Deltaproteobacteria bacterium]
MRGDQLARQWQLIQRLARSRAGVGLDELAKDLDCVRRTVYRDLDALMYAGFPVVSEKRDNRVFYRFLDSFRLGDVPFTPDELLALAFSEDLLRVLEGTVFHDSIRSALAKIRAGLGPELSSYLSRLTDSFRVLPGPHKRYAQSAETIRLLNESVLSQRTISIEYRTGRSGEKSVRELDPYRVWYRNGGLYVIGHDHRSGEIRTFAVDRILAISATSNPFEIDEGFDFESTISSAFGVISEVPVAVRIRFEPAWRSHVMEHNWHPSQKISELEDGSIELFMEVGGSAELRNWVMSFGSAAEVLEPASLRSDVIAELRAASERYGAD